MRKIIYILALLFLGGCPGLQQTAVDESVINFDWSLRTSDPTGYWLRSTLSTPADSAKVFYYNAGRELLLIDYIYRKHPDSTYSYRLDFKSRWIQDKPTWKAITIAVQVYYNDSNYTYNTYVPVATIIGIVKKKDMATFKGIVNVSGMSGAVTNAPLPVVLDNMPADFWSTVTADGGDIRAYADAALTNELPREVVSINTVAQTGVLWLQADTISNGEDIYITVDGVSADYADTAMFGSQNVWTNGYSAVYHMEQGNVLDSTINANDGTNNGSTAATGQLGGARSFDGIDDTINIGNNASIKPASITLSAWVRPDDQVNTFPRIIETQGIQKGYILSYDDQEYVYLLVGNGTDFAGPNANVAGLYAGPPGTWHHLHAIYNAVTNEIDLYVDGVKGAPTETTSQIVYDNGGVYIGGQGDKANTDSKFSGRIDEVRISSIARSADWVKLQYQSQSDNAAFWTWTQVEETTEINATAAITDGQEIFSSTGQILLNVDSDIAGSPEKLQAAATMLLAAQTNLSDNPEALQAAAELLLSAQSSLTDSPETLQAQADLLIGGQASITAKQEIFHATADIILTVITVSITDSPEQVEGIIILNFEPMHLITGVRTPNTLTAEGQKTPAKITIEGQRRNINQVIP